MIFRLTFIIKYALVLSSMCCLINENVTVVSGTCLSCDGVGAVSKASSAAPSDPRRRRGSVCLCKRYRCSCCVNFSLVRKWKALGCFHIESLPGNLNILLSISFNKRHLAVFPIAGSRPMPFCREVAGAVACLVVYDVRTDTPHDVTVCLYAELRVGGRCLATVHLDCVRKVRRRLQFVPARSAHRPKGSLLDVQVMPNDTKLTILKQEFHWTRGDDSSASADAENTLPMRSTETRFRFLRWIMRPIKFFW